jgi:hypothetical protein
LFARLFHFFANWMHRSLSTSSKTLQLYFRQFLLEYNTFSVYVCSCQLVRTYTTYAYVYTYTYLHVLFWFVWFVCVYGNPLLHCVLWMPTAPLNSMRCSCTLFFFSSLVTQSPCAPSGWARCLLHPSWRQLHTP